MERSPEKDTHTIEVGRWNTSSMKDLDVPIPVQVAASQATDSKYQSSIKNDREITINKKNFAQH